MAIDKLFEIDKDFIAESESFRERLRKGSL